MTRLNSQGENSWCVNNSWVNTICYCHHWGFQRHGTILGPGLELSSCQLPVFQQPGKTGLEREGVWKGLVSKRKGRYGKETGTLKAIQRVRERRVGSYTCPHVPQHTRTHTHTVMPICEVRELVINGIFTRFHNLLYSFLPSARDLCIHHILAALTLFLWFHVCSSTDIQDVQFILLSLSGTQRGGDVEEPV